MPSASRRWGCEVSGWEDPDWRFLAWESLGWGISPAVAAIRGASQRRQFAEIAASSRPRVEP